MKIVHEITIKYQKMLNALLILHYKNNEVLKSTFGNFEMHIFYPPAKDVFKVPSNNPSNSKENFSACQSNAVLNFKQPLFIKRNCSSLAILYIENNKTYAEESPRGKSFEEDSKKDCQ
ncbi:hypothetical protein T09_10131 [Trichinella sp. T9]|nr:hypothetical protein T09_10131 [Trichinella sp. T9]